VTRQTAIVTGSTSGIGHAIARRLHADGLNVVITGRDERRGRQVCAELGDRATFVALDLTNRGAPATPAATAVTTYGQLDVVVNNAAQDYVFDLLDAPIDEIRHIFNVNAIAPIAVLQETAKVMHHGGAIINISSRLASIGIPTMSIYGATKGAINALTTAAAVEVADRNIRVNAVAPGMTRTPLYDTWSVSRPTRSRPRGTWWPAFPWRGWPRQKMWRPSSVFSLPSRRPISPAPASRLTAATQPVKDSETF
jgi:NAD(P)-dependent dehydrogenase (short-subunit alcohol dehydrogenase family)